MIKDSGLYVGRVRHRRFTPILHQFDYPIFMPLINLDELPELAEKTKRFSLRKWSLASFYRPDYMQGREDTKQAAQDKLADLTGVRLYGKVLVLCQLRYFGLYFSPVNFYYLYDQDDNWQYLLAEVSNTPWNERHYYAVPALPRFSHSKAFHVSPFNPLNQRYDWRIKPVGDKLFVHLETHREGCEFDATLQLKKQPFTSSQLTSLICQTPIMTIKIVIGIYWQALILWVKGAIFYPHSAQTKE